MNILFVTLFALETNTSVTKSNYGILKGLLQLGHRFICCENTVEALTNALMALKNTPDIQYETPARLLPVNVSKEILV